MAKKKQSKQKKMSVRVDFTPMVDMMMLLITFFMLCTSLSKPQAMQLTMPTNDNNLTKQDKTVTKASHTITLYLASNNKLYYIEGLPKFDDPTCMKETTYGPKGLRQVLIKHTVEEGYNPVAQIMKAKQDLDAKHAIDPKKDDPKHKQAYQDAVSQLKEGMINGQKIATLTVIIKPMDTANYNNMVEALDEMQICSIGKYVIDKVNPDDQKLLKLKGVK
jgi:biopolymer transport protein ExbD